jgi:hypothetical protein
MIFFNILSFLSEAALVLLAPNVKSLATLLNGRYRRERVPVLLPSMQRDLFAS